MKETPEVSTTSSSMKSPSKPSEALITSVHRLLAAVAHERHVRPIVDAYARAILEKHQWPAVNGQTGTCQAVTDPSQVLLLSDEHLWAFVAELKVARIAAGLTVRLPDGCPLEEAVRSLRSAEAYLVDDLECYEGMAQQSVDLTDSELQSRNISSAALLRMRGVARALDFVTPFVADPIKAVIHGLRADEYLLT